MQSNINQCHGTASVDKGYGDINGGTENHLMLIDLRNKNINWEKGPVEVG